MASATGRSSSRTGPRSPVRPPSWSSTSTGTPSLLTRGGPLGVLASRVSFEYGLVVGKLAGVVGASLVAMRLGLRTVPEDMGGRHLWGLGAWAGIGFTVALLVTDLAYSSVPGIGCDDLDVGQPEPAGVIAANDGQALAARTSSRSAGTMAWR